jgi:indole-3-glycerol phosphate synthase
MQDTPDILKKILARKVEEIDARNRAVSLEELTRRVTEADAPRGFLEALRSRLAAGRPATSGAGRPACRS